MKKFLISLLTLVMLVSLVSCGERFKPVKSTKEEKAVVMTLSLGRETYKVKYELYRAFFLSLRDEVDGGDRSVWSGSEKDKYISKINGMIAEKIAEIYAAIHLADEIDFDIYDGDVDDLVEDYIALGVDNVKLLEKNKSGRVLTDDEAYAIYLANLKALNLNYSVHDLLFRYDIALGAVEDYYFDFTNGKIGYTKNTVKDFYNSSDTVRVMQAYFNADSVEDAELRATQLKLLLDGCASDEEVADCIISRTISSPIEVHNGTLIAKNSLYAYHYPLLAEAAFSLEVGQVSEVLHISDNNGDGYYVLYRAEKSNENFDTAYEDFVDVYLASEFAKIYKDTISALKDSCKFTDKYSDIVHSRISMD